MEVKSNQAKNRKYTTMAWLMAVLVFLAIIPFNLLMDRINKSWDMTPNQLYTLTNTTTDYLNSIADKEVTIYLLMDLELVKQDADTIALYKALEQYDEFDCVNIVDFDPDTNPDLLAELNPDGFFQLSDGDLIFKCGDMLKRLSGSSMYEYEVSYDDDGNEIVEAAYFKGENYITGAIKTVVEGEMPTVYFLTGHGEKAMSEYSTFQANLANYNYGAKALDLISADAVPDDAKIIIVAAPQEDITDAERTKLDAFLDAGGNISFLMSPNETNITYKNISLIMKDYCLGMDYDITSETDTARQAATDSSIMRAELVSPIETDGYPDLTSGLINSSALVTYMPPSRSFYTMYGDNYTTLIMDTLMETANTAIGTPYGGVDEDPEPITGLEMILSAYSMDTTRNNSKILVMGNAEFIDDEHLDSDYYVVPVYLFLSTVTWMYNTDIDMNIADREKTYDYMQFTGSNADAQESKANRVLYIFGFAPVVVAALGVVVWIRRRNS